MASWASAHLVEILSPSSFLLPRFTLPMFGLLYLLPTLSSSCWYRRCSMLLFHWCWIWRCWRRRLHGCPIYHQIQFGLYQTPRQWYRWKVYRCPCIRPRKGPQLCLGRLLVGDRMKPCHARCRGRQQWGRGRCRSRWWRNGAGNGLRWCWRSWLGRRRRHGRRCERCCLLVGGLRTAWWRRFSLVLDLRHLVWIHWRRIQDLLMLWWGKWWWKHWTRERLRGWVSLYR